jgi:mono/diheme cytochrome c family protein
MRRVLLAVLILALVGAAGFWFLTRPETIAASALAPHKPNLENGRVMFFAGGCAACHATPQQDDRTRLGGGMELKSPYGSF